MFILANLICSSQVYYDFPDTNTIWNINLYDVNTGSSYEAIRYVFYEDTEEINDTIYNKLYVLNGDTTLNGGTSIFYAYFREDSLRKVYCRFDSVDILLYDFSLEVGDTIFYDYYYYEGGLTEQSHYSVLLYKGDTLVNGENRSTYYLTGGAYPDVWIEGVGSITGEGLFCPIADICLCGKEYRVSCIKEESNILFQNNTVCNKCFCVQDLEMDVKTLKVNQIEYYPNPVKEILIIKYGNDVKTEIYSIKGNLLIQSEKKEIDLSSLSNGIYITKFYVNDILTQTDKLIINNAR